MKCVGDFKFKGLSKVDAGSFKRDDGEVINYKEGYKLKVDEMTADGVQERSFKIAIDSVLIDLLKDMPLYKDIKLEFDVKLYNNGSCRVVPVGLVNSNNK